MIHFITSKYGKINELKVYRYKFNERIEPNAKIKLSNWLKYTDNIDILEINNNYFKSFSILEKSKQYKFEGLKNITPPFENIAEISSYLSKDILKSLTKEYSQHNFRNMVIVDNHTNSDFLFLKCVKFNVQVFKTGRFYIHFFPATKIVNGPKLTKSYLSHIKNQINPNLNDIRISIRSKQSFKSITRDISNKEEYQELIDFFEKNKEENLFITFNYRSLSQINTTAFGELQKYSTNYISEEINILKYISSIIKSDLCKYYDKPLFRFRPLQPENPKNIVVGNNRQVEKQSAAYHNGIYKSINNTDIRQVFINTKGEIVESNFRELLSRYNGESEGNKLIKSICIKNSEIDDRFELPENLTKNEGRLTLNAIFTQNEIPEIFFERLFDSRHVFQIYTGRPEPYKLDNFTVKCLCKAGGILNIIHNLFEAESTYFLGIDLGHSKDFSVLGITLFDSKGILLKHEVSSCYHSESLDPFILKVLIFKLYKYIYKNELTIPRKVIIHRDGKNHKYDIDRLVNSIMMIFRVIEIDIVEVIKSGYPIIGVYDESNKKYNAPNSGHYFKDKDEPYAILVTNTQVKKSEIGRTINPIIIKHVYGKTEFKKIVEQVFWFTKVYTNNLYNSSRLPATTEKANNIVGTGIKRYESSYLG